MGQKTEDGLRRSVERIIDQREPATTLTEVLESIDASDDEIISVLEDLQINGEIEQEILLWKGGDGS